MLFLRKNAKLLALEITEEDLRKNWKYDINHHMSGILIPKRKIWNQRLQNLSEIFEFGIFKVLPRGPRVTWSQLVPTTSRPPLTNGFSWLSVPLAKALEERDFAFYFGNKPGAKLNKHITRRKEILIIVLIMIKKKRKPQKKDICWHVTNKIYRHATRMIDWRHTHTLTQTRIQTQRSKNGQIVYCNFQSYLKVLAALSRSIFCKNNQTPIRTHIRLTFQSRVNASFSEASLGKTIIPKAKNKNSLLDRSLKQKIKNLMGNREKTS